MKKIYICQISITVSCFSDKILLQFFKNSVGHLLFWSEKLVSKWAKISFFDVSRILIRKATNYAICMLLQTLTLIWSHNNCFRKISWNLKTTAVWKCPQDLQVAKILNTVFPRIVSAETILFWKWKMWKFSYSFRIMAIFYFINWIVATETIEGGKLFKGGNYSRKYGK